MTAKPLNILMVDDEPDLDLLIRQRFRKEISQGHYDFTFARNGREALAILQDHPEIKIVVTDLHMPQMNGIELLIQVRNRFPHTKNLVISAYGDQQNVSMARNAGAIDFLTKPINFIEFESKLTTLLA
jgi:adenylate cyclase